MKKLSKHAPSHLREGFQGWLDHFENYPTSIDGSIEVNGQPTTGRWLVGQLWNCTDTLPSGYCDQLDIAKGSTYASAVQSLRREIGA